MKILVLMDSFKGTIKSKEANKIISKVLSKKGHGVSCISISDGGEGFLESLNIKNKKNIKVLDGDLNPKKSYYCFDKDKAYIELALVCGMSSSKIKNPMHTSTLGIGQIIEDAIVSGCKEIYLGIGGSSTNDLGLGILEGLGAKFYSKNKEIKKITGKDLINIDRVDYSEVLKFIQDIKFITLSDVTNELIGPNGSSNIFSKQKGANEEEIKNLEAGARNIIKIIGDDNKYHKAPSSGASGGVGYIMMRIFNSTIINGIDFVLDNIKFNEIIDGFDVVITGEGKIDDQSLKGKVISGICKKTTKPVIALVGVNDLKINEYQNLTVYSIVPTITTINNSLKKPKQYLKKLIQSIDI